MAERLRRELGVGQATMLGLGSIVGTGVFVSLGLAAGAAGPAVVLAVALAAGVAACNALSSAQLAASHPVSGGTYEYGYAYLNPWLGFTAGWMFLCAKSASAATAALGFAGYLLNALGLHSRPLQIGLALAAVLVLTAIVLGGMRRSSLANVLIVSVTLLALLWFVVGDLGAVWAGGANWTPFLAPSEPNASPLAGLLQATALMFVAYTGYGRIATLGEEVREPRRTIPAAIVVTLLVSMLLYLAVAAVALSLLGAGDLAAAARETAAPLEAAAEAGGLSGGRLILAVGAVTAMLGVLLNLLLGLSRVVLAMGRRRDLSPRFGRLDSTGATPTAAVGLVGLVIAGLVLVGDVETTWSFSAVTVLVYYGLTNLAALRLPPAERLYPRGIAWAGLLACGFLACWVDPPVALTAAGILLAGLVWKTIYRRTADPDPAK